MQSYSTLGVPRSGQKYPNRPFRTVTWATIGYNRIRETQFLSVKKLLARPGSSFGIGNRKTICQIFRDKAAEHFIAEHRKTGADPTSGVVGRRKACIGVDPPISILRA
jgi:hypothetical protein